MTALKKPSLEDVLKNDAVKAKRAEEYAREIENDLRKLREFNRQADRKGDPNYLIERRAPLAGRIDETKLAYFELTGHHYQPKEEAS